MVTYCKLIIPYVSVNCLSVTHGHFNAIFDLAWSNGHETKLVSVSGDHTAVLWDVKTLGHIRKLCTFKGHTRSIKTVTYRPNDKGKVIISFYFMVKFQKGKFQKINVDKTSLGD